VRRDDRCPRKLGFDRVFDTSFSADLTIIEEASELAQRVRNGASADADELLAGWIKVRRTILPGLHRQSLDVQEPQQMLGALSSRTTRSARGSPAARIFSVIDHAVHGKEVRAGRPEMAEDDVPDVDAVLTTRELARLIRMRGLEPDRPPARAADMPFGERSTAGKLFGASGGVMEAAIRTAHYCSPAGARGPQGQAVRA